jgi:hypothetical protein
VQVLFISKIFYQPAICFASAPDVFPEFQSLGTNASSAFTFKQAAAHGAAFGFGGKYFKLIKLGFG